MVGYMLGSGWKKMFRGSLPKAIDNIDDLDELEAELKSCNTIGVQF